MTAVAVLAALVGLLLLPLLVTAVRQRGLVTMARRNISRRRGEAALVVAGALLGTAIITSAFVVGDVIEGSFADAARTQYGPVDITLTAPAGLDVTQITEAVQAAGVKGILCEKPLALSLIDADALVAQLRDIGNEHTLFVLQHIA